MGKGSGNCARRCMRLCALILMLNPSPWPAKPTVAVGPPLFACGRSEPPYVGNYNAHCNNPCTPSASCACCGRFPTLTLPVPDMSAVARLAELKLELPPAPKPVAVYQTLVIVGNMA